MEEDQNFPSFDSYLSNTFKDCSDDSDDGNVPSFASEFTDDEDCAFNTSDDDGDGVPLKKSRLDEIPTTSKPFGASRDWSLLSDDFTPKTFKFSTENRANIPPNCAEPIDYFQLFFTNYLIRKIVDETNAYAISKLQCGKLKNDSMWNSWETVNEDEFKAFLGVILNMGFRPQPNLQDYFSMSFVAHTPFYRSIFKRERFLQIYWMLHLYNGNENTTESRINKIDQYLSYLEGSFREYFIPGREIAVGESTVDSNGNVCFIKYDPNKPTKRTVRIYFMVDSKNGYIYSFIPCYGSFTSKNLTRPELNYATRIVLQLYNNLLKRIPHAEGYHIYTDRFYTSLQLSDELLKRKAHLTGTIMINRKDLGIEKIKLEQGEVVTYGSDDTVLIAWKKDRPVYLLTNCHSNKRHSVKTKKAGRGEEFKPEAIIKHTRYMGSVNRADLYTFSYPFMRNRVKWWRKIFFWGLEVAVVNSYVLYKADKMKNNEKPMPRVKFMDKLVIQLIGNYRKGTETPRNTQDPEERLNSALHILMDDKNKKYRDCTVCSNRNPESNRKRTTFYCKTCTDKPALCVGTCFEKYHTLRNYKSDLKDRLQ